MADERDEGESGLETRLRVHARTTPYDGDEAIMLEAADRIGELWRVSRDALYSLRLYRTALGDCEAWIDLGLIGRFEAAIARLERGGP